MLKRDIWRDLTEWKGRKHHPLVIKGLRQTGKTFIAKTFGEKYYKSVVYADLRANKRVHYAFEEDFDVDRMTLAMSASGVSGDFIPGKTLIILDEIQDCPNARSSLKYWDMDGRYDVIATGSFPGVKGFRGPYLRGVPVGYEEQMTLYPLSFGEFLQNTGIDPKVMAYIERAIQERSPIDKAIHESVRALYAQYLVVGGMPEAVNVFLRTHDLNAVRQVQRRILTSIRDDFGRYKDSKGDDMINEVLKLRAEACLDAIPAQLSREYKKFKYSEVNAKGHSTDKADGLQYLVDMGLVVLAHNTREISYPLEGVSIPGEFKAYFIDTGLLVSRMGEELPLQILKGDISAYKGAIAENMVASAFAVQGMRLYYYHAPSGSPELDFLIEKDGEAVIVECKATNRRATSMRFVLSNQKKYGYHPAIKIADTNIGGGEGFDSYPLYAPCFLIKREAQRLIPMVEVRGLELPEEAQ